MNYKQFGPILTKILSRQCTPTSTRNIMHSTTQQFKESVPLKLAYASYEDTRSLDMNLVSEAPPLIIMHGLFGSKANWNSLCKAMQSKTKPNRKIIAVDARNHGDSPHNPVHTYESLATDIKHLIDTERLGSKVALLGHSMGGRAMMLFALKWPELVDRLLVADISPITMSAGYPRMIQYFNLMQKIKIPLNLPMSKARQVADQHLSRHITDKGVRQFLITNLVQQDDGAFKWRLNINALLSNYVHIGNFPQFCGEKRYTGPTVFIAGGSSDYIQKKDHEEIKKLFPKAEFVTIEGAGHWLHSEKPAEFLDIVLGVLNRQEEEEVKEAKKIVK